MFTSRVGSDRYAGVLRWLRIIKASLRSHEVGADNVRPFELKGEQLVMRIPVTTDTGEARTRFVVWRRAERFEP